MTSARKRTYVRPQFLRQQRLSEITAQMKVSGKVEDNIE